MVLFRTQGIKDSKKINMEDLKYLSNKNNVLQLMSALQKIARTIRTECQDGVSISNIKEVDFLKQQCFDENTQLSLMTFQTFVHLVEDGTLDTPFVLSMFISMLPSANKSQYTALSEGVISLLLLDLKRHSMLKQSKYVCPFGMKPPQHPLIMLFQKKDVNVLDLVNKINGICGHHDKEIRNNSIEFLRPVFLYMLCNPIISPDSKSLWTCLLSHSSNDLKVQSLMYEILGWANISSGPTCLYVSILLSECLIALQTQNLHETKLELCVYLTSLIEDLLRWGYDPRPSLSIVFNVVYQDLEVARPFMNIMLIALASILQSIPPAYLTELTRLLRLIVVEADAGNRITLNMVVDGLIIWIAHSSNVAEDSLSAMNSMLKHIKYKRNYNSVPSKANLLVQYYHSSTSLYVRLALLSEDLLSDTTKSNQKLVAFIERLRSANQVTFHKRINMFLRGCFLLDFDSNANEVLLEIVRCKEDTIAIELIRPWLYKLLHETSPTYRLKLLRGLPEFAVVKENIPIILNTLQSISTGTMQPLAMDLYLRLWKCEERTYPFLQKHLSCPIDPKTSSWELNVAKAYTIQDICKNKPAKHGTDLVVHLSNILNDCAKENGETATSIALDAIISLCFSHTVNIASTWNALRVKFGQETRLKPTLRLCEFFGKVPMLYSPTAEYEQLLAESISILWNFVVYADDARIIVGALNALQNYDYNSFKLADLPEDFRLNIALPSEFLKNLKEGEPEPDPVDVMQYVPGECWVNVLQFVNHSASVAASDLVAHYIRTEVDAFKSGVYILPEGHLEPRHVNRMSRQSPLKGVLKYLMAESQKSSAQRNQHLLYHSLRSISFVFAKPMPSLQWTFLVEFIQQRESPPSNNDISHDPDEVQLFCLHISANQMQYSPSATQVIVSFIIASIEATNTEDELTNCCELLPKVALFVADDLFQQWVEYLFKYTYDKSDGFRKDCWFERVLDSCLSLLKRSDLNGNTCEKNFNILVDILAKYYERFELNSLLWPKLQEICQQLPLEQVDIITVPNGWSNLTKMQFKKVLNIRCDLVRNSAITKSCSWFNAIIEYVTRNTKECSNALGQITAVLSSFGNERDVCHWGMEILSKIQSILSNEPKSAKETHFLFLLDVFYTIVVVRSGFICFLHGYDPKMLRPRLLDVFPESLLQLMTLDAWNNCEARIYEFFYNVFANSMLADSYIESTRNVLLSFKSRPYFVQKSIWTKLVGLRR